MVFVSINHKFIYIHIPRTAGTYLMENIFKGIYPQIRYYDTIKDQNNNEIDLAHLYYPIISRYIPTYMLNNYTKITVVRNPYDRIYSVYKLYTTGSRGVSWKADHPVAKHYNLSSFKDFVKKYIPPLYKIKKSKITNINLHLIPQFYFIYYKGENMVDHIIKFEKLYKINDLFKKLKLKKQVVQNKITNYSDKYDKETIKIINKVYKYDFELFNYQML